MTLKEKITRKETTIGSWLTIGSTVVAEIMATAGYDWLTIDMEHSAITLDITQELIRAIELNGTPPLVRVSNNDTTIIKRVMDAGAHGIIVPMVNSRQDAEKAVQSVHYPPRGFRGVGLARAQKYGEDFEGYRKWAENESIVICQIEHIDAVNNLASILAVDGVDGFIVGPYDLSGSLGIPGQFDHPDMIKALNQIMAISSQQNALAGFHVISPDIADFNTKKKEGYKFIAHSLDILLLGQVCRSSIAQIRRQGL